MKNKQWAIRKMSTAFSKKRKTPKPGTAYDNSTIHTDHSSILPLDPAIIEEVNQQLTKNTNELFESSVPVVAEVYDPDTRDWVLNLKTT